MVSGWGKGNFTNGNYYTARLAKQRKRDGATLPSTTQRGASNRINPILFLFHDRKLLNITSTSCLANPRIGVPPPARTRHSQRVICRRLSGNYSEQPESPQESPGGRPPRGLIASRGDRLRWQSPSEAPGPDYPIRSAARPCRKTAMGARGSLLAPVECRVPKADTPPMAPRFRLFRRNLAWTGALPLMVVTHQAHQASPSAA